MTSHLLTAMAAVTLAAAPLAHADDDLPVSPHGCLSIVGSHVTVTQPQFRYGAIAGTGVYVAPDLTATSTTYECWVGATLFPRARLVSLRMTAAGAVLPLAGADANPSWADVWGPLEHCERATWRSPTGSGEWTRDADPATPGAQCEQLD